MKKRICAVFLSLALFAVLLMSVSAGEVTNYNFNSGETPITVFWTDSNASITLDNERLKIDSKGGGVETSNFYDETLDDFTFSMLYYPSGDWFVDSIYFQWTDVNNYYAAKITGNQNDEASFDNTRHTIKLIRKENGTEVEVGSFSLDSFTDLGSAAYSLKIVDNKGDIKVYFAKGNETSAEPVLTHKDDDPLAAGYIKMFKYADVCWIDNVAISVPDPKSTETTTTTIETTTTTTGETTEPSDKTTTTTEPEDKSDPVNPVIKWTFDKAADELPFEDTSNNGGNIRWEGGKAKIFSQTVGGSGVGVMTSAFGDDMELEDFTWEFDYQPEYLSWNVDSFVFHMGDSFENSLQLRILGNDAAGLTSDVNTTGGGEAHNVKLLLRQNGVNTLLGSYNLPDGLDLVNYSVRIVMKGNNIKVWFAPKSAGLKKAVIDCTVDNLPDELASGRFAINSFFGNFLVDNIAIWNTATPNHLNSNGGTTGSPETGEENVVLVSALLVACAVLVALLTISNRKKVRN